MITQYERNRLESIKKNYLRSIFGFGKLYEDLLSESNLETLEERRQKKLRKSAEKTSRSKQFAHWFPLNENRFSQRTSNKYKELFAKSDRLYNSPLFEMRRVLNNTEKESRTSDLTEFVDFFIKAPSFEAREAHRY